MGRYTGPACKRCRREGLKLFLKGNRCLTAKCAVEQGRPAPGMHGQRSGKLTDYGQQLREKQRLRRHYGLQEGQFRNVFERAVRKKGVTGEQLLQGLELRLDNLVYRFGMATSRRLARQFVTHGHVRVNGRRATIPSMVLKPGAILEVGRRQKSRDLARQSLEQSEGRGVSPWLSLDKEALRGEVLHTPSREEIAPFVKEHLVVELYSK
jgi:small subunit ribosomal protein S4